MKEASCIVPLLMRMCLAMICSFISLNTRRSFPVFDNLSRRYQIVFRSGSLSGYPRKLRNDILSRISLSIWGSERLYHFYEKSSMTVMSLHPLYLSFSHFYFSSSSPSAHSRVRSYDLPSWGSGRALLPLTSWLPSSSLSAHLCCQ